MFLFLVSLTMLVFGQVGDPDKISTWQLIWTIIVPILAGFYEVVVRIIPTVGSRSILRKIVEILLWLSDFLDRKKKRSRC